MTSRKLLSQHALENGLVLEFWDLSRPVAGDRWQVVVEARVAVAVTPENLPSNLRPQLAEIIAALGEEVFYIKQEVRHFVPAVEVPAMLAKVQEQLLSSLGGYLAHPEFGARFIRKKFAESQEGKSWQQLRDSVERKGQ